VFVLVGCLGLELPFVLLDYHVTFGRMTDIGAVRRMTNIARKGGIASWFGTTQTLLMGLTALAIALAVRAQGAPRAQAGLDRGGRFLHLHGDRRRRAVARGARLSFPILGEADGWSALDLFPSYAWQLFTSPVFVAVGLGIAAFLWRELPHRVGVGLVFAAFSCLALAIGLDFFEGLDPDHPWNLHEAVGSRPAIDAWALDRFDVAGYDALDHFPHSLVELLEMFGMTLFWGAFLRHLAAVTFELRIRFALGRGTGPIE
jgi:hypothetical protein